MLVALVVAYTSRKMLVVQWERGGG